MWNGSPTESAQLQLLGRGGYRDFHPHLHNPLVTTTTGYLGHSVLDALIDQKTNPSNQLKQKLDAVVGRRTDMDADRQEAATRNVRQRLR